MFGVKLHGKAYMFFAVFSFIFTVIMFDISIII